MTGLFDPVVHLWSAMRGGQVQLPSAMAIPPERCHPDGAAGSVIGRERMYFTVRVNELHLAQNRDWWSVFDPLVVVVTEFNYGQERVAIPSVVGPNLIKKQSASDDPRHGVVLLDTRITGPSPYRGGDVSVSVSFYRVQRANHARALLKVVDSLSASLDGTGQMQTMAKIGSALLEGVEGLLGLQETTYLAGHRISLATSPLDPLKAGFSALISPPTPEDPARLMVKDRRLYIGDEHGVRPYRGSDFVLLSVMGSEARGDENLLPFYPLKIDGLNALWDGEEGAKRGKANLIAAYQQMRKSPDVTALEAGRLFDTWLEEFEAEKRRLERTRAMPITGRKAEADVLAVELNEAMKRLAI